VSRSFPNVAYFSKFGAFFFKCGVIFQVPRIIPSLAHFAKSGAFFEGYCILPTVPHFFQVLLSF